MSKTINVEFASNEAKMVLESRIPRGRFVEVDNQPVIFANLIEQTYFELIHERPIEVWCFDELNQAIKLLNKTERMVVSRGFELD